MIGKTKDQEKLSEATASSMPEAIPVREFKVEDDAGEEWTEEEESQWRQKHRLVMEMCADEDSNLGTTAVEYNHDHCWLTKTYDILSSQGMAQVKERLRATVRPALIVAIPCTSYCRFSDLNLSKGNQETKDKIMAGTEQVERFLEAYEELGDEVTRLDGIIIFKWPAGISGWALDKVQQLKNKFCLQSQLFEGCMVGLVNVTGQKLQKRWQVDTNCAEIREVLKTRRCPGTKRHQHAQIAGRETARSGHYPVEMCRLFHEAMEAWWSRRETAKTARISAATWAKERCAQSESEGEDEVRIAARIEDTQRWTPAEEEYCRIAEVREREEWDEEQRRHRDKEAMPSVSKMSMIDHIKGDRVEFRRDCPV